MRLLFRTEHGGRPYTVVECRSCEVLQTLEHYDDLSPDYVGLRREEIDDARLWCQGVHKLPAFRQWERQLANIASGNQRLRLLDIGCGTGGFLRFAGSLGIEPFGFDASAAQAAYARREHPNVRQATTPSCYLESLGNPDIRFDLVTMWDVLEHVRNPLSFLPSLHAAIRPGGLLFIAVPNGKAMRWKRACLSAIGRHRDVDWAPWEHVFYYTLRALTAYVRKSGFDVLQSASVACYRRPASFFELSRRLGFAVLAKMPSWSPQVSVWARAPMSPSSTGGRTASIVS